MNIIQGYKHRPVEVTVKTLKESGKKWTAHLNRDGPGLKWMVPGKVNGLLMKNEWFFSMWTVLKSPNRNNAVFRFPKFWGIYILDNVKNHPQFSNRALFLFGDFIGQMSLPRIAQCFVESHAVAATDIVVTINLFSIVTK